MFRWWSVWILNLFELFFLVWLLRTNTIKRLVWYGWTVSTLTEIVFPGTRATRVDNDPWLFVLMRDGVVVGPASQVTEAQSLTVLAGDHWLVLTDRLVLVVRRTVILLPFFAALSPEPWALSLSYLCLTAQWVHLGIGRRSANNRDSSLYLKSGIKIICTLGLSFSRLVRPKTDPSLTAITGRHCVESIAKMRAITRSANRVTQH